MLLGIRGVGKDAVASEICRLDPSFRNLKFAQPLKDALMQLFELDEAHVNGELKDIVHESWGVAPRTIMQWFGTDVMQHGLATIMPHVGRGFWCRKMRVRLERMALDPQRPNGVVSDLRFQHELDMMRECFGRDHDLVVVRITRPGCGTDMHESERGVHDVGPVDITVVNDGDLLDLHHKVIQTFFAR